MNKKIIITIKRVIGVLGLACLVNLYASTPPPALFFTGKPINYTVQLENVPTLDKRNWGIWINEDNGTSIDTPSIRRVQTPTAILNWPNITSLTSPGTPINPTELLSGKSPYFFLLTYPTINVPAYIAGFPNVTTAPTQAIMPVLDFAQLEAFNMASSSSKLLTQSDYIMVNDTMNNLLYFSQLLSPLVVQGSTLDATAAQLYGNVYGQGPLDISPYYTEVSGATGLPATGFHMPLMLATGSSSPVNPSSPSTPSAPSNPSTPPVTPTVGPATVPLTTQSSGPLQRIGGQSVQNISSIINASALSSLSMLNPNSLSSLSATKIRSEIKYYRTFLTEVFFSKLSLLMASVVAAPDATATISMQDPGSTVFKVIDTFVNSCIKNLKLARYIRSFNKDFNASLITTTNVTAAQEGVTAGQQLTALDTFAGVIVINNLPSNNPVSFGPAISTVVNAIIYPDRATLMPDYAQTPGYDAQVFGLSSKDGTAVVMPGQVKFIPAADFADTWYNQTGDVSVAAIRSVAYTTYQGTTLSSTLSLSDVTNNNPITATTTYLSIALNQTLSNVPTIYLSQNTNIGPVYRHLDNDLNAVSAADKQNALALNYFFQNDLQVQWAPVVMLNSNGAVDIIGLVKLNPYYFPLYYSGGQPTLVAGSSKSLGTYVNSATGIPYFSERRIFDSVVNFYNAASSMGQMPTAGYKINPSCLSARSASAGLIYQQVANGLTLNFGGNQTNLDNFSANSSNQYSSLQNFGLAKMAGLLQYDYLFTDSAKTNYQTLFTEFMATLKKHYLLPAFLSSASVLQKVLANPTQLQTATLGNQTDIFIQATTTIPSTAPASIPTDQYVPAVATSTTFWGGPGTE